MSKTLQQTNEARNKETAHELSHSSTSLGDGISIIGRINNKFYYGENYIRFNLSSLPTNCGVVFVSGFKPIGKGGDYLQYIGGGWEGKSKEFTVGEAKELYVAFLRFLQGINFHGRRTLLFTDAINGECGTTQLSLWDMADKIGIPMSKDTHNPNSGRRIFNCWVQLDDDLPLILETSGVTLREFGEVIKEEKEAPFIDLEVPMPTLDAQIGAFHQPVEGVRRTAQINMPGGSWTPPASHIRDRVLGEDAARRQFIRQRGLQLEDYYERV